MVDEQKDHCLHESANKATRCLSEQERAKVMGSINSLFFWAGHMIPDEWEIEGHKVRLRDTVFRMVNDEEVTLEELQAARALAEVLEKEARRLEGDLRHNDLTEAQADSLFDDICGLLRGVAELRDLQTQHDEYRKEQLIQNIGDEKRWLRYVKEVT
jgi:hypothetical protein